MAFTLDSPATAATLAQFIGKRGHLSDTRDKAGTFAPAVEIIDAKNAYGVDRLRVRPVAGQGSVWVNADRVTLAPPDSDATPADI